MSQAEPTRAVAVFCASSLGHRKAFQQGAFSIGRALAEAGRPLVYGGGSKGLMGVVSGGVLEAGGDVTGVVPFAMAVAGGEGELEKGKIEAKAALEALKERGRESVTTIVVDSMHERKMEMAKRSCCFIGLPGGFGTFDELLEVVTWSQLGIHNKPVLVVNICSYWEPLRELIRNGVREGFIPAKNERLVQFIDGPDDHALHEDFDWGKATLEALDKWDAVIHTYTYDWTRTKKGLGVGMKEEQASGAGAALAAPAQ